MEHRDWENLKKSLPENCGPAADHRPFRVIVSSATLTQFLNERFEIRCRAKVWVLFGDLQNAKNRTYHSAEAFKDPLTLSHKFSISNWIGPIMSLFGPVITISNLYIHHVMFSSYTRLSLPLPVTVKAPESLCFVFP